MKRWKSALIKPSASMHEAMTVIQNASSQIALVVDDKAKLMGTVTDGDIRKSLLNGAKLEAPISHVMNPTPVVAYLGTPRDEILALMRSKGVKQMPIVNPHKQVVGLELIESYLNVEEKENLVVLMAGGLGSRLRPLTEDCPKPLLPVSGKPILEWIVEGFSQYGFRNILISVNYKAHMIEEHFGDGARWGAKISYIHETARLGTAGALRLLREKPAKSFFVMNGDVLSKINFEHMLKFHETQGSVATLCVQNHEVQVPYGVIQLSGREIKSIEEKPSFSFLINTGIYVLDPQALDLLPPQEVVDFPQLLAEVIRAKKRTRVFPGVGFWMDIGRMEDLERAHHAFPGFDKIDFGDLE